MVLLTAKEIINELLVDVFNHILDIEEDELKKENVKLSMKEVHAIEAISRTKDKTMSNVAKTLRITVGSLTICIDRLVSKGYVKRVNDEFDRRKVLIELTTKGEEVLAIHNQFHENMLKDVVNDLSLEDNEVLIKSLETVKDYFKEKM